jgi:hypothetical protein
LPGRYGEGRMRGTDVDGPRLWTIDGQGVVHETDFGRTNAQPRRGGLR